MHNGKCIIENTALRGVECGMGTLFVPVSPCFGENVVGTCKSGSFLCSLDNLLQKNEIVFSFENQISKWRSYEKKRGAIFDLLFTFFSHLGKVTKNPTAHISPTYIHVFCSHYWLFFIFIFILFYYFFSLTKFWKKNTNFRYESWCWFLFTPFLNNW